MSLSSTYLETRKSCLNKSSSKQIFPFSKDSRFKYKTQQLTKNIDFHNFPSIFSKTPKKGHAFSRYKKQLIFQNQKQRAKTPSPALYNSKSSVQFQKQKNVGITMGTKLSSTTRQTQTKPAPNAYTISQKEMKKYSERSFSRSKRKLQYPKENLKGKDSPGPNYDIQSKKIKELMTKFKTPRRIKIMRENNPINPQIVKNIIEKKKQKFKNIKDRRTSSETLSTEKLKTILPRQETTVFGKSKKKSFFDKKNVNPGPGKYFSFSQFAQREKPMERVRELSKKKMMSVNLGRLKTIQ